MRSSPPAKGRAHEASCSVGRGAVSADLPRKQGGGGSEARQRRETSAARHCPLKKGSAKGRRGPATVSADRETGTGAVVVERPVGPQGDRLAFASGPRRGRCTNHRGGRSAERQQTDYPTRHSSSARHPLSLRGRSLKGQNPVQSARGNEELCFKLHRHSGESRDPGGLSANAASARRKAPCSPANPSLSSNRQSSAGCPQGTDG